MFALLKGERGTSVPELMMTAVIMVVVTMGIYAVFEYGIWQYNYSEGRATSQQDTRMAIDLMSRYTRMTAAIITSLDDVLEIQVDPDDDKAWETARFYKDGTRMMMEYTDGSKVTEKPLADNVRNGVIFVYYDADRREITNIYDRPTKTRQIEIRLDIDDNPNLPLEELSQGTIVELRNLQ